MKGIHVTSEIKPLKKVLLHRPGKELLNLTPDTLQELLFDDIPFLKVAQEEHDDDPGKDDGIIDGNEDAVGNGNPADGLRLFMHRTKCSGRALPHFAGERNLHLQQGDAQKQHGDDVDQKEGAAAVLGGESGKAPGIAKAHCGADGSQNERRTG